LSVPDAIWHYTYDPVSGEASRSTLAVMADMRGSVRMVMDVSTGNVMHQLTYGPWGEVLTDSAPGFQPFAFAGGVHDPRTGMLRFGRRDYDASTGRWTNRDPALFGGGQTNLYTYCAGDPVGLVDPWGAVFETPWDVFNIGLGVVSLGANLYVLNLPGAALDTAGLIFDVGATIIPGVPGGAGTGLRAYRIGNIGADVARLASNAAPLADEAVDCARLAANGADVAHFAHASQFGFGSYNDLRRAVRAYQAERRALGLPRIALEVHHLVEKRFSVALGRQAGEMISMVLTRAEHRVFTNAWRGEIGYGRGTALARQDPALIDAAFRRVYQNFPSILSSSP
jgi:RHS repeat-associated protein